MDQSATVGRMPGHIHLSATDQKQLLQMARDAISDFLLDISLPEIDCPPPAFEQIAGVFVTLRCRSENKFVLRGCIGQVQTESPLYKSVPELALKAATHDPRFPPLATDELAALHISISILSPLTQITKSDSFAIGTHGLLIEGYGRRGLLLPKVPLTWNWNKQEFLEALCRKAGLPADSYRSSQIKLYTFTTLEFEEVN